MSDAGKLLFTEFGRNHTLIKRQWVAAIFLLISYGLNFYRRWDYWRIRTRFYWLWDEVPTFPFFADLLIFAILIILIAWTTGKVINKNEIYVYQNGIEGYGFKVWDFWPRLHKFELRYDDIKSVKQRRWGISIRSTNGRYRLIVHSPEMCVEKITKQLLPPHS
ncbi:MAG: hypothetical protein FWC90_05810 [Oscillospiraceae bacterium]|nr:hypothetical protein [Oscillospiraceae bacterium]